MSRLTLEWHLRGIAEGTVDPVCVRVDLDGYSECSGRWWPGERYYADPHVEENREQRSQHDAGSYTTGFTQNSGDFCDALDVPAREALRSDDTVQFLDAVAHDPIRPFQERHDAAQLLNFHIWPDPPNSQNTFRNAERDDVDVSEWLDAGMTRRSIGPVYSPASCPECREEECLADPDTLRDRGVATCSTCGTEQNVPQYR